MDRRSFVKKNIAASALLGLGVNGIYASELGNLKHKLPTKNFKLNYAPHLGMFEAHAGSDPVNQLNFMADNGFSAFEDNEMRSRSASVQEKMAVTMSNRNMTMGVFVAHDIYWTKPNLTGGDIALRDEFLKQIEQSVEVAKRVNAKWMTVVPGYVDKRKNMQYQTVNVIESLKRASEILEPHGIIMVLEPLNFRDHPGQFLSESPQCYQICKAVNSPSCKMLFDIYHQQIQEGNLIPNIEASWDEIAYFQVGDNPGRNEPTTGEINYKNVFKFIHSKGFNGVVGMEHGNSIDGKEGELAVIEAYKKSDNF
ncbi:TIM barrel protein [Antarcticibacterium arcticum]|uniref:TIM barrel protein n=1 Tax=Antarcticibacterium arcticum TaxID=2585771 RepID=A0A5B8YPF6_9FLAO|nr:TIM barrel protein [Antarcticibacterium arcticum]QED38777.1 TIM barrel protein [Antarcticibacterium arcticum]